jgi:hypothetical protein
MQDANRYAIDQMQLVETIVEKLETWPAELQAFDFQHELFGCWYLIVRRNGKRTRFSFDGRDRYLSAERLQPSAGDFTKPPKNLGGLELPHGLNALTVSEVIEFVRAHA